MIRPVLALLALLAPAAAGAATLCVNTAGSGGCFATIQGAIDDAARGDVIEVAAGTYVENLVIASRTRLTIRGAGPTATFVDGGGSGTVLDVQQPGSILYLDGVALENGTRGLGLAERVRATLSDCAVTGNVGLGGIVAGVRSTVKITGCTISGNTNTGPGGGIALSEFKGGGRLTVIASTIESNSSSAVGGGISCRGRLTLADSTVRGNSGTAGGGIYGNSMTITGSTISGNDASSDGGGIAGLPFNFAAGQVRIKNSTISGNTAQEDGGGIRLVTDFRLEHVTLAGNAASVRGGGISAFGAPKKLVLKASLIADNTAPEGNDCVAAQVRAFNGNLIEDPSSCTITVVGSSPVLNADPLLGPLQDNGGPTETHALGGGSPALDVVTTRGLCREPDQRGVARTVPCDLGAYETP